MATVSGRVVRVGDVVCFKSDYEQTGTVVKITTNMFGYAQLELYDADGFGGDYLDGCNYTTEMASDCWFE